MTMIGSSTPTYDANGNVTNDFLHTYSWNAEGRPVTIDAMGATYNATGRMVEMNRSGTYTEIVYSPTGAKLALMNGQTLQRAFVSLPGGATAVYTSSGLDHYRHSDWLGSARLLTTPNRTESGDVAYAPYGETYAASGNNDFSWTGINADVEPVNPETLYDFPAREYGIQGRWPSPDPAGLLAVDPSNPQSWDRYAYVGNNPLAATDPSGMFLCGTLCFAAATGGGSNPVLDVVLGLADFAALLIDIFGGHHEPPHAAPAPPGGYGAGIDAYGTWDEKLPAGVQVFPHVGFPGIGGINPGGSGCTYGSGSCGGGIYGLVNIQGSGASTIEDGQFTFYAVALAIAPRTGGYHPPEPITHQVKKIGQRIKQLIVWDQCGSSPLEAIRNGIVSMGVKGAISGGVALSEGGPFGIVAGVIGGGAIGGQAGAILGTLTAGVCKVAGVYD